MAGVVPSTGMVRMRKLGTICTWAGSSELWPLSPAASVSSSSGELIAWLAGRWRGWQNRPHGRGCIQMRLQGRLAGPPPGGGVG